VIIEGTQITVGVRGTGFVHAMYAAAGDFPVLSWTGVNAL
jgi:hypothetical protein